MQSRNYASNHRSRAVVQTTQNCDAVCESVLFLAALLVLVVVFWTKMLLSFSHILVTYKLNSFSQVLVDENTKRFWSSLVNFNKRKKVVYFCLNHRLHTENITVPFNNS